MKILGDIIYNPAPRDLTFMAGGREFTFPSGKAYEWVFSEVPSLNAGIMQRIRNEMGPMGIRIFDAVEMAGGPNRESMTDEQIQAYRTEYVLKQMYNGLSKFYEHMYVQYVLSPDEDNRRLVMAGKKEVGMSPRTNYWRETILPNLAKVLGERGKRDDMGDLRKTNAAIGKLSAPDLRKLNLKDLEQYVRSQGMEPGKKPRRADMLKMLGLDEAVEDALKKAADAMGDEDEAAA